MQKHFSEIFNLGLTQPELDFVDIIPEVDTPLYIDPFAISLREDEWSYDCNSHIIDFFQTTINYIYEGKEKEARSLLNGLSEPNETCLGVSKTSPAGRGVSGKQAVDLYENLAKSQAAKTGLLEELADFDLFIEGIGRDKVSDITTNIIRYLLIQYTQSQCELHGIKLKGTYPTGRFWDMEQKNWRSDYTEIPVVNNKRIILVPKYTVRRALSLNSQEYYNHHILNFIQDEEFNKGSSLVRVLKNGEKRPPHKKTLKVKFPFSKDFAARFTEEHPEVLKKYKTMLSQLDGAKGTLNHSDFDESFDESIFAQSLKERLKEIAPGKENADKYHSLTIGILEFIFWPNLIYPKKETPIHLRRKRIDITYTNAAKSGFFYRTHTAHEISSNLIMVECKNYSEDPKNPEIDQLSGRFSVNRGKLGMLLYREADDYKLLCERCRDTASDGRGFILPLGDDQILKFLDFIENNNRSAIDRHLENLLQTLIN